MRRSIPIVITTISVFMIMAACGKKEKTGTTASQNSLSVSEEIAQSVSEDVIPVEATQYSSVSFDIPEGFVRDDKSTDSVSYYFNNQIDDLSYIVYGKAEKPDDYQELTEDKFKEEFCEEYGVSVAFVDFEKQVKDDYYRIVMTYSYSFGKTNYITTEYLFVTDTYLFTVAYCKDTSANSNEQSDTGKLFENSAQSLTLVSVVNTVSDNEVEGTDVTDETVSGNVLEGINAGAHLE